MKVLIVYFSYTSTVRQAADILAGHLEADGREVTLARILPARPRGYWAWLIRSFVPGWRVPIRPVPSDLRSFDLVFLGSPKWTVACPPVNQYVRSLKAAAGSPMALFVCHRGFGQLRFVGDLVKRLRRRGVVVVATLALRQREVKGGGAEDRIRSFSEEAIAGSRRPSPAQGKPEGFDGRSF